MTNDELEHHLALSFKLIREQAEAIKSLKTMIDAGNKYQKQRGEALYKLICDAAGNITELEQRIDAFEKTQFEEIRH